MYQLKKTRSFSQKRRNGRRDPSSKKENGIYKLNYFQGSEICGSALVLCLLIERISRVTFLRSRGQGEVIRLGGLFLHTPEHGAGPVEVRVDVTLK
jgi:hypothetical protein